MYSVTVTQQTWDFIYSLGVGFLLGVIYDLLNIELNDKLRKIAIVIIKDVLYIFICGIMTCLFVLSSIEGKTRVFLLLGELLGWVIYYFSFGIVFRKILSKILKIFVDVLEKVLQVFNNLYKKLNRKSKKNNFCLKKLKFCLKRSKVMEYNLND